MDVARAAGVGKSTVSNVLNGTGRVGEAARVRVLETVEQLGYQPHQGARSMRSRRTMRLAYLMPPIELEPTNLIMMQFMQALLTAAARQRYRVLVVPEATIRPLLMMETWSQICSTSSIEWLDSSTVEPEAV